jgi:5-methylcytosine-specific restriction endonuclease McrA
LTNEEDKKQKRRVYLSLPERKAARLAYDQRPDVILRRREREARPEAKAKQRERNKKFREKNPGRGRELTKDWLSRNPEWLKHKLAQRAALRRGAPGSHTQEEWLSLCARYDNKCAYCRSDARLSRDHVMPLTRGGTDNIDNILPACQPCNSSKGNRVMPDQLASWLESRV